VKNKWTFIKEYKMRQLIIGVIILANFAIFLVGAVVLKFLPENAGKSVGEVMRYSLKLLVDSGGFMDNVTNLTSVIVTVIIVISGMVCFTGGIIAYMSNFITSLIDHADSGNTALHLKGHIIILNWNNKVPLLVADYMRGESHKYILILTNKDKNEVLQEIENSLGSLREEDRESNDFLQKKPYIIVRKVGQLSSKSFANACITDAASLIIVSPDEQMDKSSCDACVIKQFMMAVAYISDFIAEDDYNNDITNGEMGIIVELQEQRNEKYITSYPLPLDDGEPAIKVAAVISNEVLGKIMATTVLNPELHQMITEILSFKGSELYARYESLDDDEGNSESVKFFTGMVMSNNSIPLFDLQSDSNIPLRIFVAMDKKGLEDDICDKSIIEKYITSDNNANALKLKKPVPMEVLKKPDIVIDKSVLIIGYNDKFKYIIYEMKKFTENGLKLSVAYTSLEQKLQMQKYVDELVEMVDLTNIYDDEAILGEVCGKTDVLVLSADNAEAIKDSIPLLVWNVVLRKKIDNIRFYIEVLEPQNCEIIKADVLGGNLFLSNRYVSGLCTQLGTDGNLYDAFMEMFTLKSAQNIWTYVASKLFCTDKEMRFVTKKEAILWTYVASEGTLVLIGIIRNGITYLFTNGINGLEECRLYPKNWNGEKEIECEKEFVILPEDVLVVIEKEDRDISPFDDFELDE
jgi:hypothetical protein